MSSAGAYIVLAALVIELTGAFFESLLFPPWATRLVTVLLFLGFPVVVVLAWFLDISGTGREKSPDPSVEPAAAVADPAPAGLPTTHEEAHECYLRGLHNFGKRTARGNRVAITQFERATQLDPSFARAFAALAAAYIEQFFSHDPGEEWEEKAFVAIERARALDPGLAQIYVAKGNLLWTRARRFPHAEAIAEYTRALRLEPNSAEALNELARVLWHIGHLDEAVDLLTRAMALDPAFIDGRFRLGWLEMCRGNFRLALEHLRKVAIGSLAPSTECLTALTLLYLRRPDEARTTLTAVDVALREEPDFTSTEAIFLALDGDAVGARHCIAQAIEEGKEFGHFHHVEYSVAVAYALLGEQDRALEHLRRVADGGFPCWSWFRRDPLLESLHYDPRFESLIRELEERWGDLPILAS